MKAVMKKRHLLAIALSISAMIVILGCSSDDSGLARRYSVTGNVTYKGQPVAKGVITFEPANPAPPAGRHASGFIENGYYALSTSGQGADGALPGEYNVVIASSSLDTAQLSQKTGGLLHQGQPEHVKALKGDKSPIPTKYAASNTSGLKAKVENSSKTINFELTD
jgi:hypothetical protein